MPKIKLLVFTQPLNLDNSEKFKEVNNAKIKIDFLFYFEEGTKKSIVAIVKINYEYRRHQFVHLVARPNNAVDMLNPDVFANAYTRAPVTGYESTSGTASTIYRVRYRWYDLFLSYFVSPRLLK